MTPEELKSRILYQDALIIVLNKPAGIPVHSGPGGGENLEEYFHHLKDDFEQTPGLAHRLDRDTSGCLILGRHQKALRRLGKLFMAKQITKTYWAVVHGKPTASEGRIDLPLQKQTQSKQRWWMMPHPEGQPAVTDYRVMGEAEGFTWLELSPQTGRTHQLRVHCQALGCPIVGDKAYGKEPEEGMPPMHLHARSITIPLYSQHPLVTVIAPPPEHMMGRLKKCGYKE